MPWGHHEPCPVHTAPHLLAGPLQASGNMGPVFEEGAWLGVKWRGGQRTPTQVRLQEHPCPRLLMACSHSTPIDKKAEASTNPCREPPWVGTLGSEGTCTLSAQRAEFTSQTPCQSWVDMAAPPVIPAWKGLSEQTGQREPGGDSSGLSALLLLQRT